MLVLHRHIVRYMECRRGMSPIHITARQCAFSNDRDMLSIILAFLIDLDIEVHKVYLLSSTRIVDENIFLNIGPLGISQNCNSKWFYYKDIENEVFQQM